MRCPDGCGCAECNPPGDWELVPAGAESEFEEVAMNDGAGSFVR